jgi:hypothetical protein
MRSNAAAVFKRIADKIKRMQRDIPKILANEGQKHFNNNFKNQRFQNTKWANVKRRETGTFEYKYPKTKFLSRRTNPILVGKTRRLKNAVNRSIRSANMNRIIWGVYGKPGQYGSYHNYGIGQKQRSFMRIDKNLRKKLRDKYYAIVKQRLK